MSLDEIDPVVCKDCGAEFNLSAQHYYDNVCPDCIEPKRTWPICTECDERIPPDERSYRSIRGAARDPASVRVAVHDGCK